MPPSLSDEQIATLAEQQAVQDALAEHGANMEMQTQAEMAVPPPPTPEDPGFFNQFVKPAILPTLGGVAGTALGGITGSIPGGVIGGGIGSALGEAGNQALGITEPSMGNVAMAGAMPMALGGAMALARPLMPFMGAGRAAQTLNSLAPEEAAAAVARMTPKPGAAHFFNIAAQSGAQIPLAKSVQKIGEMLDDMTNVSTGVQKANGQVIGYLKGLQNLLKTNPKGLTPIALQRELEGAGNVIKSVNTKGGTGSGAIKEVFKALVNDMDEAAAMGGPGAKSLSTARHVFKKEHVMKEIEEAITDATKSLRGQGEMVQFNANAVLKQIKGNDFYDDALSATEKGEMESLLKLLNKIPALRPGAGAQFGSGRMATLAASASAGGGTGFAMGGATGGAIGTAVGMAIPPVIEFGKNVATAMQMSTGRALMKELLKQSKGVATPQVASVIAAYAHAVTENPQLGE